MLQELLVQLLLLLLVDLYFLLHELNQSRRVNLLLLLLLPLQLFLQRLLLQERYHLNHVRAVVARAPRRRVLDDEARVLALARITQVDLFADAVPHREAAERVVHDVGEQSVRQLLKLPPGFEEAGDAVLHGGFPGELSQILAEGLEALQLGRDSLVAALDPLGVAVSVAKLIHEQGVELVGTGRGSTLGGGKGQIYTVIAM